MHKPVKLWRSGGNEAWVLVHVEVQGHHEEGVPERVYGYNNRIYDRYQRQVATFAISADDVEGWEPGRFEYRLWGRSVILEFATAKLLKYRDRPDALTTSGNPFAIVVAAHLQALASRNKADVRLQWKLRLVHGLYRVGYDQQRIIDLFSFIDWVMGLPTEFDTTF